MSLGVYPVLGRFKIPDPRTVILTQIGNSKSGLKPEMFEFMGFGERGPRQLSVELNDNYDLFRWLAGTVKSDVDTFENEEDLEIRQIRSKNFTNFIDNYTEKNFGTSHFVHDWPTLYTLDELLAVNYDVVAWGSFDEDDETIHTFHPEGKTLRQLFEETHYFEFLQEAKEKGWEFVVFQFS